MNRDSIDEKFDFKGGEWSHISTRYRTYIDDKGKKRTELIVHPFDKHFGPVVNVDLAIDLLDEPRLHALFSGVAELELNLTHAAPLMRKRIARALRRPRDPFSLTTLVRLLRQTPATAASPCLQGVLAELEARAPRRPGSVTFAGTPARLAH